MIKRILLVAALTLSVLSAASFAQRVSSSDNEYNHAEIGIFANYTRLHAADNTNFYGVGGRFGFNVSSHVQVEAEGAYDFSRNVSAEVNPGGGNVTVQPSDLRMVHFLVGPKFQVGGSSPIRVFATLKGGIINFSTDKNFGGQVSSILNGNTDGVLYPAAGVELFLGWIGVRFEAGDEIYIDHGANSNLRVTAGPSIRF